MNKYNLQVGDSIKKIDDPKPYIIEKVNENGIKTLFEWEWNSINFLIESNEWTVVKKDNLSTEYKVGDEVITHDLTIYVNEDENFKVYNKAEGNRRFRPIQEIKGEYFQLEGDFTSWFKLSDLPPKTENMQEYKVGDIVTDDSGRNLYKIREIEGNKIYVEGEKHSLGVNRRLATPEEIKQYNMKEKKIIGYTMVKSFPGAKAPVTFNTKNDKDEWGSEDIDWYFSQEEIDESPDWFIPIYQAKETILKLGDRGIEVKIGEKSITADGKAITRNEISELLNFMEGENKFSYIGWPVSFPTVKVGCTVFSQAEVDTILGTYDELNP